MMAVLLLALGAFVWQVTELLPIGLLPQIAAGLTVPVDRVGLLVTGYAWLVALSAIPMTYLTAHVDRRRLVGLLLALVGTADLLKATAPNYATVALLRVILACGHGVFWSIIAGLATRLAPDVPSGRATAWAFSGIAVALACGIPMSTALGHWLGWRSAFVVCGLLGWIACACVPFLLPAMPGEKPHRMPGELLANPALRRVVLMTGMLVTAHFCAYTYIVPLLTDRAQVPSNLVPVELLVFGIAGVIGNWLCGRLDLSALMKIVMAIGGIILAQVILIGGHYVSASSWTDMAIWGLSSAFLVVGLQSRVLEVAVGHEDAASSLYVAAFNVGIGSGALLGGVVLSHAGITGIPWASMGIAAFTFGAALTRVLRGSS